MLCPPRLLSPTLPRALLLPLGTTVTPPPPPPPTLQKHGLGDSALGSVGHGDRVPEWLEKWAALVGGGGGGVHHALLLQLVSSVRRSGWRSGLPWWVVV